jgi:hypothetical protein
VAYNEQLAARVRKALGKRSGLSEKKMFGGIAFLLRGNMCVGVHGNELIARLDPATTDAALAQADTRPFDMTGRPMKGWILVQPNGLASDGALGKWVAAATAYADSLPKK